MRKIISLIIGFCFLVNNVSFALSPPMVSGGLGEHTTHNKNIVLATAGLAYELEELNKLEEIVGETNKEKIKEIFEKKKLFQTQRKKPLEKKSVFDPAEVTTPYINMLGKVGENIFNVPVSVKKGGKREDYQLLFSTIKDDEQGFPIFFLPNAEFKKLKDSVSAHNKLPYMEEEDAEFVNSVRTRYARQNEDTIDKLISGIITGEIKGGNFAEIEGRREKLKWSERFLDAKEPDKDQLLQPSFLEYLGSWLNLFLSKIDDGFNLEKAIAGKNLVLIKLPKGVDYPVIKEGDESVSVHAHTSNNAIYLFLKEAEYNLLQQIDYTGLIQGEKDGKDLKDEEMEIFQSIFETVVHEIGVIYGARWWRSSNSENELTIIRNKFDYAYSVNFEDSDSHTEGLLDELKEYVLRGPVNLDELFWRDPVTGEYVVRDHAMGETVFPGPAPVTKRQEMNKKQLAMSIAHAIYVGHKDAFRDDKEKFSSFIESFEHNSIDLGINRNVVNMQFQMYLDAVIAYYLVNGKMPSTSDLDLTEINDIEAVKIEYQKTEADKATFSDLLSDGLSPAIDMALRLKAIAIIQKVAQVDENSNISMSVLKEKVEERNYSSYRQMMGGMLDQIQYRVADIFTYFYGNKEFHIGSLGFREILISSLTKIHERETNPYWQTVEEDLAKSRDADNTVVIEPDFDGVIPVNTPFPQLKRSSDKTGEIDEKFELKNENGNDLLDYVSKAYNKLNALAKDTESYLQDWFHKLPEELQKWMEEKYLKVSGEEEFDIDRVKQGETFFSLSEKVKDLVQKARVMKIFIEKDQFFASPRTMEISHVRRGLLQEDTGFHVGEYYLREFLDRGGVSNEKIVEDLLIFMLNESMHVGNSIIKHGEIKSLDEFNEKIEHIDIPAVEETREKWVNYVGKKSWEPMADASAERQGIFVGKDPEIIAGLERAKEFVSSDQERVLLVRGAKGDGKSHLAKAVREMMGIKPENRTKYHKVDCAELSALDDNKHIHDLFFGEEKKNNQPVDSILSRLTISDNSKSLLVFDHIEKANDYIFAILTQLRNDHEEISLSNNEIRSCKNLKILILADETAIHNAESTSDLYCLRTDLNNQTVRIPELKSREDFIIEENESRYDIVSLAEEFNSDYSKEKNIPWARIEKDMGEILIKWITSDSSKTNSVRDLKEIMERLTQTRKVLQERMKNDKHIGTTDIFGKKISLTRYGINEETAESINCENMLSPYLITVIDLLYSGLEIWNMDDKISSTIRGLHQKFQNPKSNQTIYPYFKELAPDGFYYGPRYEQPGMTESDEEGLQKREEQIQYAQNLKELASKIAVAIFEMDEEGDMPRKDHINLVQMYKDSEEKERKERSFSPILHRIAARYYVYVFEMIGYFIATQGEVWKDQSILKINPSLEQSFLGEKCSVSEQSSFLLEMDSAIRQAAIDDAKQVLQCEKAFNIVKTSYPEKKLTGSEKFDIQKMIMNDKWFPKIDTITRVLREEIYGEGDSWNSPFHRETFLDFLLKDLNSLKSEQEESDLRIAQEPNSKRLARMIADELSAKGMASNSEYVTAILERFRIYVDLAIADFVTSEDHSFSPRLINLNDNYLDEAYADISFIRSVTASAKQNDALCKEACRIVSLHQGTILNRLGSYESKPFISFVTTGKTHDLLRSTRKDILTDVFGDLSGRQDTAFAGILSKIVSSMAEEKDNSYWKTVEEDVGAFREVDGKITELERAKDEYDSPISERENKDFLHILDRSYSVLESWSKMKINKIVDLPDPLKKWGEQKAREIKEKNPEKDMVDIHLNILANIKDYIKNALDAKIFMVNDEFYVSPRTEEVAHVRRGIKQDDTGIYLGELFIKAYYELMQSEGKDAKVCEDFVCNDLALLLLNEGMHIGNPSAEHKKITSLEDFENVTEHIKLTYFDEICRNWKYNMPKPWVTRDAVLPGRNIGNSEAIINVFDQLGRFVKSNTEHNLFIDGETGSGKDMAVQAVQALMTEKDVQGKDLPVAKINCAVLAGYKVDKLRELLYGKGEEGQGWGIIRNLLKQTMYGSHSNQPLLIIDNMQAADEIMQNQLLELLSSERKIPMDDSTMLDLKGLKIVFSSKLQLAQLCNENFDRAFYQYLSHNSISLPELSSRDEDIIFLAEFFNYAESKENNKPWAPLEKHAAEFIKEWFKQGRDTEPFFDEIIDLKNFITEIVKTKSILLERLKAQGDLGGEDVIGRKFMPSSGKAKDEKRSLNKVKGVFSKHVITLVDIIYSSINKGFDPKRENIFRAYIAKFVAKYDHEESLFPYFKEELAPRDTKGKITGFYKGRYPWNQPGMTESDENFFKQYSDSMFIFSSNAVFFSDALRNFLPEMINNGLKVAVLVQDNTEIKELKILNRVHFGSEDKGIIIFKGPEEAKDVSSEIQQFYYFGIKEDKPYDDTNTLLDDFEKIDITDLITKVKNKTFNGDITLAVLSNVKKPASVELDVKESENYKKPWETQGAVLPNENIGNSKGIVNIFKELHAFVRFKTQNTLLLEGLSGSGKTKTTEAIEALMDIKKEAVRTIDCAALARLGTAKLRRALYGSYPEEKYHAGGLIRTLVYEDGVVDSGSPRESALLIIKNLQDADEIMQAQLKAILHDSKKISMISGEILDMSNVKIVCQTEKPLKDLKDPLKTLLEENSQYNVRLPELYERGKDVTFFAEFFNFVESKENDLSWAPLEQYAMGLIRALFGKKQKNTNIKPKTILDLKNFMAKIVKERALLLERINADGYLGDEDLLGEKVSEKIGNEEVLLFLKNMFSKCLITCADIAYSSIEAKEYEMSEIVKLLEPVREKVSKAKYLFPYFQDEFAPRDPDGKILGFYKGPSPWNQPGMQPARPALAVDEKFSPKEIPNNRKNFTRQLAEKFFEASFEDCDTYEDIPREKLENFVRNLTSERGANESRERKMMVEAGLRFKTYVDQTLASLYCFKKGKKIHNFDSKNAMMYANKAEFTYNKNLRPVLDGLSMGGNAYITDTFPEEIDNLLRDKAVRLVLKADNDSEVTDELSKCGLKANAPLGDFGKPSSMVFKMITYPDTAATLRPIRNAIIAKSFGEKDPMNSSDFLGWVGKHITSIYEKGVNPYWKEIEETLGDFVDEDRVFEVVLDDDIKSVKSGRKMDWPFEKLSHDKFLDTIKRAYGVLDSWADINKDAVTNEHYVIRFNNLPIEIRQWIIKKYCDITGEDQSTMFEDDNVTPLLLDYIKDWANKARKSRLTIVEGTFYVSPTTNTLIHDGRGINQDTSRVWMGEYFLKELALGADNGMTAEEFAVVILNAGMHMENASVHHGEIKSVEDIGTVIDHILMPDKYNEAAGNWWKYIKNPNPWQAVSPFEKGGGGDFDDFINGNVCSLLIQGKPGSGLSTLAEKIKQQMQLTKKMEDKQINTLNCEDLLESVYSPDGMRSSFFGSYDLEGVWEPGILKKLVNEDQQNLFPVSLLVVDNFHVLEEALKNDDLRAKALELLTIFNEILESLKAKEICQKVNDTIDVSNLKVIFVSNKKLEGEISGVLNVDKKVTVSELWKWNDFDIAGMTEEFSREESEKAGISWAPLEENTADFITDHVKKSKFQIKDLQKFMKAVVSERAKWMRGWEKTGSLPEEIHHDYVELQSENYDKYFSPYFTSLFFVPSNVIKDKNSSGRFCLCFLRMTNWLEKDQTFKPYFKEFAPLDARDEPTDYYSGPFRSEKDGTIYEHPSMKKTSDGDTPKGQNPAMTRAVMAAMDELPNHYREKNGTNHEDVADAIREVPYLKYRDVENVMNYLEDFFANYLFRGDKCEVKVERVYNVPKKMREKNENANLMKKSFKNPPENFDRAMFIDVFKLGRIFRSIAETETSPSSEVSDAYNISFSEPAPVKYHICAAIKKTDGTNNVESVHIEMRSNETLDLEQEFDIPASELKNSSLAAQRIQDAMRDKVRSNIIDLKSLNKLPEWMALAIDKNTINLYRFADLKGALVFSENVTFKNGVGALLSKLVKAGIKIAVVARTEEQIEAINVLNQIELADSPKKIVILPDPSEARNTIKNTQKFYYFHVKEDLEVDHIPDDGNFILNDITGMVKQIIEALGRASGINVETQIRALHTAAQKFAQSV